MKKRLLVLLFSLASLGLVSCGGGNDVASTGATAVSAAAPASNASPASAPSTAAIEAKVNGQIDERTGVAPVVAQATIAQIVTACEASSSYGGTGPVVKEFSVNPSLQQCWDALPGYQFGIPWAVNWYGGCAKSISFGGTEPLLTLAQKSACITALDKAENIQQCFSLGGKSWTVGKESGGCDAGLAVQTQPETVADYSNGGCGRSSTFGGSGPALTLAQKSACITAFNEASTFQQCFSLGGIWGGLPPNIDGRTGLCGWRYKWLIGG